MRVIAVRGSSYWSHKGPCKVMQCCFWFCSCQNRSCRSHCYQPPISIDCEGFSFICLSSCSNNFICPLCDTSSGAVSIRMLQEPNWLWYLLVASPDFSIVKDGGDCCTCLPWTLESVPSWATSSLKTQCYGYAAAPRACRANNGTGDPN